MRAASVRVRIRTPASSRRCCRVRRLLIQHAGEEPVRRDRDRHREAHLEKRVDHQETDESAPENHRVARPRQLLADPQRVGHLLERKDPGGVDPLDVRDRGP